MSSSTNRAALNVVLFSGGRGSGVLSRLLASNPSIRLTVAINGYDDGASTGEVRRFLVGPKGCEITGITATPDGETLFVNVQHPGEGAPAEDPSAVSDWPDRQGRPRAATLAIRKVRGGIVGS